MIDLIRRFFQKSKQQKGYIYICKYEAEEFYKNLSTGKFTIPEKVVKWKYGKTKNIEQRMKYYGENYTLIESWKVNHLTMREENIRSDWSISDDRREAMKDARDEHVDFDCYDIVKQNATCKIELKRSDVLGGGFDIVNNYSCGGYSSGSANSIFEYLKVM